MEKPTMTESTTMESRLDKLEQDNRRLMLAVGALLLVMAAVPLIGAVMPEQIPDLMVARRFEVIDENDTKRIQLDSDGIFYIDANGNVRVGAYADGVFYMDENGKTVDSLR